MTVLLCMLTLSLVQSGKVVMRASVSLENAFKLVSSPVLLLGRGKKESLVQRLTLLRSKIKHTYKLFKSVSIPVEKTE